jgi:MoaA/NifB/PqqE/SkfB family radical SAM enzyme
VSGPTLDGSRELRFTWDLLYTCNYRCPYCWWDPHWNQLSKTYASYPSAASWTEAWARLARRHGPAADLSILGGEPFLFAGFDAMVRALSAEQGHRVCVTTNLSVSKERLDGFVRGLDPRRLSLSCSYHPHFVPFEEALERVTFLADRGFRVPIYVVTYPPFLDDLPRYAAACRAAGVEFHLRVFRGEYNGRPYPRSFTEEETRRLADMLDDPIQTEYQVALRPTLGEPCYAGAVYANVKPDGEVYRCGQASDLKKPVGNLFDPEFRLWDRPAPCPFTHCSCQEYEYLARVYEPRLAASRQAV